MTRLANDAHERFAHEYLVDLNATAAYRRVYPKAKGTTAEVNGCRLLGNAKVAARVGELQSARSQRTQITADMVIAELARLGFSDMRDFTEWGPTGVSLKASSRLTDDQARCVAEVSESIGEKSSSLRFKLHDKVGALVKLGQHLGLFTEKVEHSGPGGGPIEYRSLSSSERARRVQELLALASSRASGNGKHP